MPHDAFGKDAQALNAELSRYAGVSRFNVLRLPFKPIDVGPISVWTVSSVQDALLPSESRARRGWLAALKPAA